MNWWQTLLISTAVSVVSLFITYLSNHIINRNKQLKFFVQRKSIDKTGYFRFELTIYNPATIPQFYDTLLVAYYSNQTRLGETRLETTDESTKNSRGELQGFFVPAYTVQSHSIKNMVVFGHDKTILLADRIDIEYTTYWANSKRKSKVIASMLMNKEQIHKLLNENMS